MEPDYIYFDAEFTPGPNVKLTQKATQEFIGKDVTNEKNEVVGKVVSATLKNNTIKYKVKLIKDVEE